MKVQQIVSESNVNEAPGGNWAGINNIWHWSFRLGRV